MHQITEDTFVGYDNQGNEIRAEQLQRWAYNQLAAAPALCEALKKFITQYKELGGIHGMNHGVILDVELALAKAEAK